MTKTILKLFIGLLALVLIAEFYARVYISHQLSKDDMQAVSVSFGAQPLIPGLVTKKISHLKIDSPDTVHITHDDTGKVQEITGQPATTITIDGLSLTDPDNPTAEHITVASLITSDYILADVQKTLAENTSTQQAESIEELAANVINNIVQVTAITPTARTGSFDVEISSGAAILTFRPEAVDGTLQLTATNAHLFGFELPDSVVEMISKAFQQGTNGYVQNLHIDTVIVTDTGFGLTASGNNVKLSELDY